MINEPFTFKAKVWLYTGQGAWHFATLPIKTASLIKDMYGHNSRGFGSLRVSVTVGNTTWKTSIFPDSKVNSYLLPIKADVRKKEGIQEGDEVEFTLEVI